ncbi:MAG: dTDP-4-dehydrorhamnose reductase [candidate division Zixibacteria bacterium]|nr:dTDP-4-dehydrorhamnose reductase [candidate division Zixibacteria bacterium]
MTGPKVLVTGCKGQLGSDFARELSTHYDVSGIDIDDADITDFDSIRDIIIHQNPQIVLHTAAYTDVESCESNSELAMAVNVDGTENVARACREVGARMIYFSTDYVFDGEKGSAYVESDIPNPQTVYGRSKFNGEKVLAVTLDNYVICRLAWLYGEHGTNFVRTMVKLGYEQQQAVQRGENITPLKVVDDQIGNPTWTVEIVQQVLAVMESDISGILHCSSEGETSWYGFAKAVFEYLEMSVQIRSCTSNEFPQFAHRPRMSSLINSRLEQADLNRMRNWRESLEAFLRENKERLLP